jgi:hypothetical protein
MAASRLSGLARLPQQLDSRFDCHHWRHHKRDGNQLGRHRLGRWRFCWAETVSPAVLERPERFLSSGVHLSAMWFCRGRVLAARGLAPGRRLWERVDVLR